MLAHVVRAGDEAHRHATQEVGAQRRVRQAAHPDGQVEAPLHERHDAIRQVELEAQRDALTDSNRQTEDVNRRLADERAYLSTILESVATGILACTDQLELLSINRAALRILQLEQEPAPGSRLDVVLTGELGPIGGYLRELRRREPRPREVSLSRGDEIRYLEISAARMTSGDKTIGWVVAIMRARSGDCSCSSDGVGCSRLVSSRAL